MKTGMREREGTHEWRDVCKESLKREKNYVASTEVSQSTEAKMRIVGDICSDFVSSIGSLSLSTARLVGVFFLQLYSLH